MTADYLLDHAFLGWPPAASSTRCGINRVTYDITSKSPVAIGGEERPDGGLNLMRKTRP